MEHLIHCELIYGDCNRTIKRDIKRTLKLNFTVAHMSCSYISQKRVSSRIKNLFHVGKTSLDPLLVVVVLLPPPFSCCSSSSSSVWQIHCRVNDVFFLNYA